MNGENQDGNLDLFDSDKSNEETKNVNSEYAMVPVDLTMVPVDMMKIDLPLFKNNAGNLDNPVVYILSKKRESKLTVIPPNIEVYKPYGFDLEDIRNCIPGIIENKVYHALILILKNIKEEQNLSFFPNQLITTTWEIAQLGRIARADKSTILRALIKLKNTTYVFENSFYSPVGTTERKSTTSGIFSASILNDFYFVNIESISKNDKLYDLLKTRSNANNKYWNRKTNRMEHVDLIVVNLHDVFIKNYQHKKGYLLHPTKTVETLLGERNDNIMDLYYFLEKNRNWYNNTDYDSGKTHNGRFFSKKMIIRISAEKLTNRLRYSFEPSAISKTLSRIEKILDRLKELNLIFEYIPYKNDDLNMLKAKGFLNHKIKNTLANTEYEILFNWSRDNSLVTKELGLVEESSAFENEIDPVLLKLLEPFSTKLSKSALIKINQYYKTNNLHYVAGNLSYTEQRATENFERYLLDALEHNYGATIVEQLIEAERNDEEQTLNEQREIDEKINKQNKIDAKEREISKNFNKLHSIFIKLPKQSLTEYKNIGKELCALFSSSIDAPTSQEGTKSKGVDSLIKKEVKVTKVEDYFGVMVWYFEENKITSNNILDLLSLKELRENFNYALLSAFLSTNKLYKQEKLK